MSNYRKLHAAVREACKNAGWDVWFTYNDKAATSRRLSYTRNGWPVPSKMKAEIVSEVNKILKQEGLDSEAEWIESESWRGPYDKLIMRVPL